MSQDVPSICYTNTNYQSDSIPIGVLLVEEFGLSENLRFSTQESTPIAMANYWVNSLDFSDSDTLIFLEYIIY
jgi:hypothetical protein